MRLFYLIEIKVKKYYDDIVKITKKSRLSAKTIDGTIIEIFGNIDSPLEADSVLKYGGAGIGLFRTEFHYMKNGRDSENGNDAKLPSEDELFASYKSMAEKVSPKPVIIRTLDINGDKNFSSCTLIKEKNPALGLRAIRWCLKNPEIFKIQLKAILRAAICENIKILFPMITCLEEVIEAKKILAEAARSLDKENLPYNKNIEIGIMIEVPSAVMTADILSEHVDFFSIGTNDLIQYTLATDRGSAESSPFASPLNPAVIRMINHVARVAREKKIKIFMCGEMAAEPFYMPLLLGAKIEALSMSSRSIPLIKETIRKLDLKKASLFLNQALKVKTAGEMEEIIKKNYPEIISL